VIALDLQDAMSEIGFKKARSLAMWVQPDVALVDVCLDGGREGIEAARWLREVCEVPVVLVTGSMTQTLSSVYSGPSARCSCVIKARVS
jgi:hypothetical protein